MHNERYEEIFKKTTKKDKESVGIQSKNKSETFEKNLQERNRESKIEKGD